MTAPYRKKLIEVALPLKAINEASAREKSIRHGHPSTLHLWWARRPLAACRAVAAANTALIDLYWALDEYLSRRIAVEGWGQGTVGTLSEYIQRRQPGRSGFSASNLWRMRQFFE